MRLLRLSVTAFAISFMAGAVTGVVVAFFTVFFKSAGPGDWLSFLGSLMGSLLAVAGAVAVIFVQRSTTERRHHRTIRVLIASAQGFVTKIRGLMEANAAEDQAAVQMFALARSLKTLQRATDKLMGEGPAIAWLAGAFDEADDFSRSVQQWNLAQKAQWQPSATELVDYAADVLTKASGVLDQGDANAALLTVQ